MSNDRATTRRRFYTAHDGPATAGAHELQPLEPPAVLGAHEVRVRLAISRPTFAVYRSRPDFPPARELGSGPVFEARAIEAYALQRETGRPYLEVLREYRAALRLEGVHETHAIDLTSSRVPTTSRTVRRLLEQLGEIPS